MYFKFQLGNFSITVGKPEATPNALEGERKLISAAKYLIADRGFKVEQPVDHGDIFLDDTSLDDELFAALRLISDVINGRAVAYVDVDECVDALLELADETTLLASTFVPDSAAKIVVNPSAGARLPEKPVDYIGSRWPR
jgi:hypothetical protein